MTKFVDIEIGADIGQIRLYTTDEDYETYDGEDILNLINNLSDENGQLKQQVDEMITIFENSGLDYHISDELNEILNR